MTADSFRALFDLAGRTAVVTGAAGILGRRFSAGLADFGARVACVDLDGEGAGQLAKEIAATHGVETTGLACDVSRPESVGEMVERVERELGPIDVLHNNAATKTADIERFLDPLEDYDLETWREVMGVNLDGMFLVARAVGARMAGRGRGSIVQTASIYGHRAPDQRIYEGSEYLGRPINTPPVYSASKAGVIGLTRHLAAHWADKGVRVNALTPGGVESGQNETFKARYAARVPLGRMAEADEMVGALVFLASDASSYVTGQNIVVDGGLSAW
jgi:NAD(P)-dependent dehydrogenase (short-subunit alcohol dehydrogenase family)